MGSPTGVSSKRCGDHGAGLGIVPGWAGGRGKQSRSATKAPPSAAAGHAGLWAAARPKPEATK